MVGAWEENQEWQHGWSVIREREMRDGDRGSRYQSSKVLKNIIRTFSLKHFS